MNRTLRRTGTRIVLTLYFVWLLAVVALLITRFTPGPVPTVVDWVVVAGAGVGFLIGLIQIVSRTPQYVEKLRGWLSYL
jgi:hypothetical protein